MYDLSTTEFVGVLLFTILLILYIYSVTKIIKVFREKLRSQKEAFEIKLNLFEESNRKYFWTYDALIKYIYVYEEDILGEAERLLLQIQKSNQKICRLRLSEENFDSICSKTRDHIANLEVIRNKYTR